MGFCCHLFSRFYFALLLRRNSWFFSPSYFFISFVPCHTLPLTIYTYLKNRSAPTMSFESPDRSTASYSARFGSWLTVREALERSPGLSQSTWWYCEGVHGEKVEIRQHRDDGPQDRPIWDSGNGRFYLGGWRKHPTIEGHYQWHGWGVYCRYDGRVFVGEWNQGKLCGLGKRIWLPTAPCWIENRKKGSEISIPLESGEYVGVPYIYLGEYRDNWKDDPRAMVLLKDGTTRRGPWKQNKPVGDWWEHERIESSLKLVKNLLSFANRDSEVLSNDKSTTTNQTAIETTSGEDSHIIHMPSNMIYNEERSIKPNLSSLTSYSADTYSSGGLSGCNKEKVGNSHSSNNNGQVSCSHSRDTPHAFQVARLRKWLCTEVIGFDARPEEMQYYACRFLEHGLHSPTIIKEMCRPADVAGFLWMKDFHRRRLLAWIQSKSTQHEEHWCQHISGLAEWLRIEAIGYNADKLEMIMYAQNFFNLGYHSVAVIKDFCTNDELMKFPWMKPAHKRVFISRIQLHEAMGNKKQAKANAN